MEAVLNLTQNEQAILNRFQTQVQEQYPDVYRFSLMFGSKARGDFHAESDIDVAIFLSRVDRHIKRTINDIATELFLETDIEIAPLIFQVDQYEQMCADGYPITHEIEKHKVKI